MRRARRPPPVDHSEPLPEFYKLAARTARLGMLPSAPPPPDEVCRAPRKPGCARKPLRDAALSEEARAAKCERGLRALLAVSAPAAMSAAWEAVEFGALPDEAVLCACQAVSKPDVSGRAAAAFVAAVLRPRLACSESAASRILVSALLSLQLQHAKPMLEELIVPTLWHANGALSAGQAEVLKRLLNELPEALLPRVLSAFLAGEGGQPQAWQH